MLAGSLLGVFLLAVAFVLYFLREEGDFTILQRAVLIFLSINLGFAGFMWIVGHGQWVMALGTTCLASPVAFLVCFSEYRNARKNLKKLLSYEAQADLAIREGRKLDYHEAEVMADMYRQLLGRVKETRDHNSGR